MTSVSCFAFLVGLRRSLYVRPTFSAINVGSRLCRINHKRPRGRKVSSDAHLFYESSELSGSPRHVDYFSVHDRDHLLRALRAAARGTPASSRDCASCRATFGKGTRIADHWRPSSVDDVGGAS